jgi:hypothetical protein
MQTAPVFCVALLLTSTAIVMDLDSLNRVFSAGSLTRKLSVSHNSPSVCKFRRNKKKPRLTIFVTYLLESRLGTILTEVSKHIIG